MRDDVVIHNAPIPVLSQRRQQILEMIAEGYFTDRIARELGVKKQTVKSHVRDLLAILGGRDRAHLMGIAHRCGLLGEHRPRERTDVRYAYLRTPKTAFQIPDDRLTISHIGGDWWTITRDGRTANTDGGWDRSRQYPDAPWTQQHRFHSDAADAMARFLIHRESAQAGSVAITLAPTPRKDPTP